MLKPDFKKATEEALYTLQSWEVDSFPVDLPKMIRIWFYDISIKTFHDFEQETGYKLKRTIHGKERDGQLIDSDVIGSPTILYNEGITHEERIFFTIAHELGHLSLGHPSSSDRSQLNNYEYQCLEDEANCFARNLLTPAPLALKLLKDNGFELGQKRRGKSYLRRSAEPTYYTKNLKTRPNLINILTEAFHISKSAAEMRADRIEEDMENSTEWLEENELNIAFSTAWKCNRCGTERIPGAVACTNCGHNRFTYGTPTRPASNITGFTKDHQFIVCHACGNSDFSPYAQYCKICGSPLFNRCTENPTHLNYYDSNYCWACGEITEYGMTQKEHQGWM